MPRLFIPYQIISIILSFITMFIIKLTDNVFNDSRFVFDIVTRFT